VFENQTPETEDLPGWKKRNLEDHTWPKESEASRKFRSKGRHGETCKSEGGCSRGRGGEEKKPGAVPWNLT